MSKQQPITTLIVDLTGVLFTIDQWKVFKLMGFKNVLLYVLTHFRNPFKETLALASVIAKQEAATDVPELLYKGYQMPSALAKSHMGIISAEQAHKEFKEELCLLIKEGYLKSKLEIFMMQKFVDVISDPKTRINLMTPNYALANLITELPTINKRYILSNLDESTYRELVSQYPDIFILFNAAVISAEVGSMKPDLGIYELLLSKYDILPETCLFLDDQKENIESAEKLGIKSILYTSMSALRGELRKLNLYN